MAASPLTEKQFQKQVIDLLHIYGYRVSHFMAAVNQRGQWRTPVAADGKGFPDLVAVRKELAAVKRRPRVLFIELKTDKGRLSKEQKEWHEELIGAGAEAYVWRPRDWKTLTEIVR